ncbi:MAG: hypothetical protein IGR93_00725 [Hydrococcus sp. C42_A2020_068]|uniref:DUF7249 family protein n=1 Tax=Pleurocapsa sp. PCC 7327 TaxID=118163 RepID=UPI00029F9AAF|nr:hypothetical protein [Pleurocapsa sp. PCC 7327]AFY78637.1 hypothetical protein Ple7327_3429 [Pleurocapsa sp. PCC 7327]MBF2018657.1 hypothetical protein [Hydrococcus sp. C42_A2020_068]
MTYKGFKNYSTWLVHLWLTKEENTHNQLQVLAADARNKIEALAKEIEALVTDFNNPLSGHNSLYTEILQEAFDEVDWEEIAQAFLSEER